MVHSSLIVGPHDEIVAEDVAVVNEDVCTYTGGLRPCKMLPYIVDSVAPVAVVQSGDCKVNCR